MLLTDLFILSLANYALAITITRSVMFNGFREWMKERSLFLGNLFSCPYCFGHWSAAVLVLANGFPSHEDIEGITTLISIKHIGFSFDVFSFHHYIHFDPIQFVTYTLAVIGLSAFFSYGWIWISGYRQ